MDQKFGSGYVDRSLFFKGDGHLVPKLVVTLPETNSSPLKIGPPKRNFIFQLMIFRGHVSFIEASWRIAPLSKSPGPNCGSSPSKWAKWLINRCY